MTYRLIAESGSTKTDWVLLSEEDELKFTTQGSNPSANEDMFDLGKNAPDLLSYAKKVEAIHFFGAGIIDDIKRLVVKKWLLQYFPHTSHFEIEGDMFGAARSVAGDRDGIICILGTGSNSCVYQNSSLVDNIPALGFALSNEGGGSKIGGELLKSFFYRRMPKGVHKEFTDTYGLSKSKLVEHLYKGDNPTAYLASFAGFLNKTQDKEWRTAFLTPLFQEFIDIRIKQYSEYLGYDLYFVGSIAYFYADVINDVLQANGLTCKSIIRKPIDGLVDYYK